MRKKKQSSPSIAFPKSKPKPSLTPIRKEVEDLAKLLAKHRANWICQKCLNGRRIEGSNCHGAHIIPVSHGNSLRFDVNNILCLCFHHHISWLHKNPLEGADWLRQTFPDRIKYIEERKNKIVKYKYEDYVNMKQLLLEELKQYE